MGTLKGELAELTERGDPILPTYVQFGNFDACTETVDASVRIYMWWASEGSEVSVVGSQRSDLYRNLNMIFMMFHINTLYFNVVAFNRGV